MTALYSTPACNVKRRCFLMIKKLKHDLSRNFLPTSLDVACSHVYFFNDSCDNVC